MVQATGLEISLDERIRYVNKNFQDSPDRLAMLAEEIDVELDSAFEMLSESLSAMDALIDETDSMKDQYARGEISFVEYSRAYSVWWRVYSMRQVIHARFGAIAKEGETK